jgi:hypothetical protein
MLPPKSTIQPVTLAENLTVQWLFEGKAFFVHVSAHSREVIDTFITSLNELLSGWDPNQPLYIIIDAFDSSIVMSPYLSAKIKEPTQIARAAKLHGMYYALRPQGFVGELVERLGNLFVRSSDTLRLTWVKSIEEAITLIEAQLAHQETA